MAIVGALGPAPAWALHKESPPAYRITRGSSHHHPVTRSWGNYFAFSSSDDLVGNGNNRREIFIFNLGFFDCFNGTTFSATPCPNPLRPFLYQATNGPGDPDNPSVGLAFDTTQPPDGIDDSQWLAFDALGNYSGGAGAQATHRQIFMKNLITNEVRQITFGTDGDSTRPNLSSLGGMIVFESTAHLTPSPTPAGVTQIYAYESNTRTLRQITAGNGPSTAPIPNNSAQLIAFQSTADLLGNGADTGVSQIYWAEYDKPTHTSTLHRLTNGNGPSQHPYISEVNSFIVFDSSATDLPGTLGGSGTSIYLSTPLKAPSPQPPTLRQLTNPTDFGNCTNPGADEGSVADHIGMICDGDPLANGTTGRRAFVFEISSLTLFQLTGSGDIEPPIGQNLGGWFMTFATTSDLTGGGSCGYQLNFIDYLPTKWPAATQLGQLPPDGLAASGSNSTLIGLRVLKVLPGDGTVGSKISLTTSDGSTVTGPPSGGNLRLVMGAPDEFTGEAPIRLDHTKSLLEPITIPGWGTACFALPADGLGTVKCDAGAAADLAVTQDHRSGETNVAGQNIVDDTNPSCLAPACREDDPTCHPVLHGPHRTFCPVCSATTGLGTCIGGPNDGQPCTDDSQCDPLDCANGTVATCNGPIEVTPSGSAAPGAMLLTMPAELSIATNRGGDGKWCTSDDSYTAVRSVPISFSFTTGAVTASIVDRDAVFGMTLDGTDTGAAVDCARLRANDLGGLHLSAIVPILDVPDVPQLRDVLLNLNLEAAPPDLNCSGTACSTAADCNDGNPCNGAESCVDGVCLPGSPFICDDGDPCNGVETCDPSTGACVSGTPCQDGNPCNGVESCDLVNGCVAGTPISCLDTDKCNGDETCNPADGTCLPGTPLNCDDMNDCTADSCDAALGCVHTPIAGTCDDGNACTTGDTCVAGACVGTPTVCDDGMACNGVETCDTVTGACVPGTPPNCDDGNPCTDELCDNTFGCLYTPNTGPCDDSNACTTGDTCVAGACVGTPVVCDDANVCNGTETCNPADGTCQPGTPLTCDDGNVCTNDTCDATLGCLFVPNSDPCDDGSACTTGDTCTAGACVGTPVSCLDGNVCNGTETCDPSTGACVSGPPLNCDDGDACTIDSCDPVVGCLHVADPLCLSVNLLFATSSAPPAALGGSASQQQLVTLLTTTRKNVELANLKPKRARRAYKRAYRALVKYQRKIRKGMQRHKFDVDVASELMRQVDRLMPELQRLVAGT